MLQHEHISSKIELPYLDAVKIFKPWPLEFMLEFIAVLILLISVVPKVHLRAILTSFGLYSQKLSTLT